MSGLSDSESNTTWALRCVCAIRLGLAVNVVGVMLALGGIPLKEKAIWIIAGVVLNVAVISVVVFTLQYFAYF